MTDNYSISDTDNVAPSFPDYGFDLSCPSPLTVNQTPTPSTTMTVTPYPTLSMTFTPTITPTETSSTTPTATPVPTITPSLSFIINTAHSVSYDAAPGDDVWYVNVSESSVHHGIVQQTKIRIFYSYRSNIRTLTTKIKYWVAFDDQESDCLIDSQYTFTSSTDALTYLNNIVQNPPSTPNVTPTPSAIYGDPPLPPQGFAIDQDGFTVPGFYSVDNKGGYMHVGGTGESEVTIIPPVKKN